MTDVEVQPITVNVSAQAPSGPPDDAAPIRAAIDRFRTTAQWIVGAFAAIGAVVAAAVPFAAISGVEPDRQAWLVTGAILSLGGVGLAITATAANLVPRAVYPHEIGTKRHPVRRYFSGRRAVADALARHGSLLLPNGYTSATQVQQGLENLELILRANPTAANVKARHAELSEVIAELQWMVRFEKARNVFRLSLIATIVGALAVGAGLGCLLFGLRDAKSEAETDKIIAEAAKLTVEAEQLEQELEAAGNLAEAQVEKVEAETAQIRAAIAKLEAEQDKVEVEARKLDVETDAFVDDREDAAGESDEPSELEQQTQVAQIDLLRAQAEELRAQAELLLEQARQLASAPGG